MSHRNVKIIVEQEVIDINAKNKVYFKNYRLQNNICSFLKLLETALIKKSGKGSIEIIKTLKENNI